MTRDLKLERNGFSDAEAASVLFPNVLARHFWVGVIVGILLMAGLNIGDVHICVGECDGSGFEILSGVSGDS